MIAGQQIIDEARRWKGVRYVHQGRSKFGVDCIGLVICVRDAIEAAPMLMSETTDYARHPQGILIAKAEQHCTRLTKPEPGCIILIKWFKDLHPSHAALYCGENMIHCYKNVNKVVEVGYRAQWVKWTHSFWRLPGVAP